MPQRSTKTNQQIAKINYLNMYNQAYENATDLLREAKILFDNKCYARSYFLAYTALEEISKSQFAADVFTEFRKEEDFLKFYTNHNKKNENIEWAHYDANSYPHNLIWVGPGKDDIETISAGQPLFKKRNNSLYVGINNNQIVLPKEKISKNDTREIIHLADTAFQRIGEVSGEFGGNQIGTKGFMK